MNGQKYEDKTVVVIDHYPHWTQVENKEIIECTD